MKRFGILWLLALAIIALQCSSQPASKAVPTPLPTAKEKSIYAKIITNKGTILIKLNDKDAPKTVENFVGLAMGTKAWTDYKTNETVTRPFYDGLTFHRVIKDFMIQGGCPVGDGTGGPGYEFEDETYTGSDQITGAITDEATALLIWNQLIVPYMQEKFDDAPNEELKAIVDEVVAQQSGSPMYGKTVEYFQELTGNNTPVIKQIIRNKVLYGTICMANSGPNTNGSQFFIVTQKEGCAWLDGVHTVFGNVVEGMDVVHAIEAVAVNEADAPVEPVIIEKVTIIE